MSSHQSPRSSSMAQPASLQQAGPYSRRESMASPPSPLFTNPRVQLVPHSRTSSYDGSLSPTDIELLANTNFDAKDVSSKDFDFEDVFTYDKPQRKLKSVVEVSAPARNLSNFSFSHYPSTSLTRQKYGRSRSTASELYVKNQGDARNR